ncbi:hypothetical protein [Helicobacter sp. 23-1045]
MFVLKIQKILRFLCEILHFSFISISQNLTQKKSQNLCVKKSQNLHLFPFP